MEALIMYKSLGIVALTPKQTKKGQKGKEKYERKILCYVSHVMCHM